MSDTNPTPAGEMLPCPFCGFHPHVKDHGTITIVYCPKHSCVGPAVQAYSEVEAIALWNRRIPKPAAMERRIVELEAELAAVRAQLAGAKPGIVWQLTEVDMPALEAEIERLRAEPRYVPVEDGDINTWVSVEDNGRHIAVYVDDERYAEEDLPEGYAVCRLVPGQDTQPGDGQEGTE